MVENDNKEKPIDLSPVNSETMNYFQKEMKFEFTSVKVIKRKDSKYGYGIFKGEKIEIIEINHLEHLRETL